MAKIKDLPYFKFKISKWLTGNISTQDMAVQGVFINICAIFWSRECELSYQYCLERFKKRDRKHIETLLKVGIIRKENDQILIDFLQEQLKDFGFISETNTKNIKKRYETQQNQGLESTSVEVPVYNIDKIREDKRREYKINIPEASPVNLNWFKIRNDLYQGKVSEFFKKNFQSFLEQWLMKNNSEQNLLQPVLERFDKEYSCYSFTNENHIQNTFKSIWDKEKSSAKKESNTNGQQQTATTAKIEPGKKFGGL